MIRLFTKCRFREHSLFLNTFLPFMTNLVEEHQVSDEHQGALLEICEAALISAEEQCAYNIRNAEPIRFAQTILTEIGQGVRHYGLAQELTRVRRVYELRWSREVDL